MQIKSGKKIKKTFAKTADADYNILVLCLFKYNERKIL